MLRQPIRQEALGKPIVAGHSRETRRYATKRTHGTDDCLLIYTVLGKGRFGYGNDEAVAIPGSLIMWMPHTPHDYGTARGATHWELMWTHFQPHAHWDELLSWPEIAPGLMRLDVGNDEIGARVDELFPKLIAHAASGRPKAAQFALATLEEMLLWCDTINPLDIHSQLDPRIRDISEHISSHLASDLTIEALAMLSHMSASRFSHLFQENMGITPQKFVESKRIERAKTLLVATRRSVGDISADVGFDNPYYFSLRFKKATGLSPTEFRFRTEHQS